MNQEKIQRILILLFLIISSFSCRHNQEKKITLVNHFIQSHNQGVIQEKMFLVTENFKFIVDGWEICNNKEGFKDLSDWDKTMNSQLTIYNIKFHKNEIQAKMGETSVLYQALGIQQALFSKAVFSFEGDSIKSINIKTGKDLGKQFTNAFQKLKKCNENTLFLSKLIQNKVRFNKQNAISIISDLKYLKNQCPHFPGIIPPKTLHSLPIKGACEDSAFQYDRRKINYPDKWTPHGIYGGFISPDGKKIGVGNAKALIQLWDADSLHTICDMVGHRAMVSTTLFSPDSKILISGSSDSTACLWNTENCKLIRCFNDHNDIVFTTLYGNSGKYFATTSDDSTVIVYHADTYQIKHRLKHDGGQYFVWISNDDKYIATGGHDFQVTLWDMETGNKIREFKGHKGPVYCMVISSDNKYIVSGAGDFSVKLWDLKTGECLKTFCGHQDEIFVAMFSPDEQQVISSSGDQTIRRWDIKSGEEVMRYEGHTGLICTMHNHPDGKRLLSGGMDGSIRIWDIESGKLLASKRMTPE